MLTDNEIDDVIEMLDAHFGDKLSVWESEFVRSVGTQWEEKRYLSDKQRIKLDQIAERCAREYGR